MVNSFVLIVLVIAVPPCNQIINYLANQWYWCFQHLFLHSGTYSEEQVHLLPETLTELRCSVHRLVSCGIVVFHYLLNSKKRLHRRGKKASSLLFSPVLLFSPCFPLCWSLRMPLTWWSCSAPSSPARRSLSGTAIHRASSPTRRWSLLRTTAGRWCLTGTAVQLSPCVWPSPPRRQKPCHPLWPSAAPRKPSPSPARTWPATCVRSSGTWSTRGSSEPWPRRAAPPERSAAWQRCALSAPSVHLRVQKRGFR